MPHQRDDRPGRVLLLRLGDHGLAEIDAVHLAVFSEAEVLAPDRRLGAGDFVGLVAMERQLPRGVVLVGQDATPGDREDSFE